MFGLLIIIPLSMEYLQNAICMLVLDVGYLKLHHDHSIYLIELHARNLRCSWLAGTCTSHIRSVYLSINNNFT